MVLRFRSYLFTLLFLFLALQASGADFVATFVPGLITFHSTDPWTVPQGEPALVMAFQEARVTVDLIDGKDPAEARVRAQERVVREAGEIAWEEEDTDTQEGMPLLYLGGKTKDGARKVVVVIFQAPGGLVLARGVIPTEKAETLSQPVFDLLQEVSPVKKAADGK